VIARGPRRETPPIVLDVFTLSSHQAFQSPSLTPKALVVARGLRGDEARRAAISEAAYGLTSAEAKIALLLAEGNAIEEIAMSRDVAVGTVRAQIKAVFAKMGVSRQMELAARLNQL
jgi:DNA-binding CsgD family transcriptional regulator